MNGIWTLPDVDEARCTLCGQCVQACPCHSVRLGDRGPIFSCPEVCPRPGTCPELSCSLCEEACPAGAITCAFEIVMEASQAKGLCQPHDL